MIALGMEELALSVVHDPQRVESGRLQLDRLQR